MDTSSNSARQWTPESLFAIAGLMALAVRLVQGWIFWGGASRRLFYDFHSIHGSEYAVKLDPNVHGYLANKLVHAMPGSMFPGLLQWVVMHGGFLLFMVWFWSLVELVVGVGLILGIATRLLAFASLGLNISLMLIFGWMGSTCVDEWTMAAAGFAMGATLMVTGSGLWSVDHWIANRWPSLGEKGWFRWLFSGPLPMQATRRWGAALGVLSLLFTVGFYQYIHGAVISPLHARVSFHKHDLALNTLSAQTDGKLRFHAYVDAGPDTGKLYLIDARLVNAQGKTVENWNGKQLSTLPKSNIDNLFHQPWASQIKPTRYGLGGITGAKAFITLPGQHSLASGRYTLRLMNIDGRTWSAPVTVS